MEAFVEGEIVGDVPWEEKDEETLLWVSVRFGAVCLVCLLIYLMAMDREDLLLEFSSRRNHHGVSESLTES
jgi:hypothetical protein